MISPEHALIIARTLKDVALVLGLAALTGLAILIVEFARKESATGRDIDRDHEEDEI
jgi:hypothetical protein